MKPEQWIVSRDTGLSSITIWAVMMDVEPEIPSTPSDPADFGRCYRLLKHFPHWRPQLQKVSDRYPAWRPFVRKWDQMTVLYELAIERPDEKKLPDELFKLMQQLRAVWPDGVTP